jgi:glycosyltransferase involved in cell wall biosynthesis
LRQTYTDFELVVIDDGSTDDTRSVVKSVNDDRLEYYYKDNGGQSSALNLGLVKAKGKYIAYLDSDDLWPPNYLETVVEQLEENTEYGAAYARVIEVRPDGSRKEMSSSKRYRSGWITKYFFEFGPCLMPSATCFRRFVWRDVFWDEALKRGHDFDVFLRISTKTQFLFVPNSHVIKRWYPENLSSSQDPINLIEKAYVLERFYFHFDGSKYASLGQVKRKISRAYRKAGKICQALGDKDGALAFFKRATRYYPKDVRLYIDLVKTALKSRRGVPKRDWQVPEPLPPYITVSQKSH